MTTSPGSSAGARRGGDRLGLRRGGGAELVQSRQKRPSWTAAGSAAARPGSGANAGTGCGSGRSDQLGEPCEVLFENAQHRRRVQRRGRVVERVEQHRPRAELDRLLLAVDARDPDVLAAQLLRRVVAEARDHLRLDQLDLPEEVRLAGLLLVRDRIAVARWSALDDVRDVDVGAVEPDPGEQLVEQLAGLADERDPLLVLVEARALADEHQVGVRAADSEHDLRAALGEPAARAARDLARERFELGQLFSRSHTNHRNNRLQHRR